MDVYEKCVVGTLQSCSAIIDPEKRVRGSVCTVPHLTVCSSTSEGALRASPMSAFMVWCVCFISSCTMFPQKSTRGRSRDLYLKGLLEAHATVSRSINAADFRL